MPLPPDVEALEGMSGGPLVVGLIASPERIVQIRRNRLMALHETQETDYVAEDRVRGGRGPLVVHGRNAAARA